MIAYLKGIPFISGQILIIDVNGVGYGVKVTPQLLNSFGLQNNENTKETELYIYTHVKEEKLELYGFESDKEKDMFELVLGVSGVGPSIALNLVAAGPHQLIEAVQNAQVSFFSAVPRVGKKLAQKIIIELRGKLGELKSLDLGPKSPHYQEIYDALSSFGFDEQLIGETLGGLDIEELETKVAIKLAMKKLSSK
ncbi:MAG: Holliday junction branch migration protein RuvA [Candidatus Pacebacteria bacterium]|nr:Holliday junction branch migration protein RuvA [Candidatus Paceibacterota bacterium]